jgi:hypothetical protein
MDGIRVPGASVMPLDLPADGRGKEPYFDLIVLVIPHSASDREKDKEYYEEGSDHHHDRGRDGSHSSYLNPTAPCSHRTPVRVELRRLSTNHLLRSHYAMVAAIAQHTPSAA